MSLMNSFPEQVLEAVKNQENRDRDLLQQFAEIYDTDRESIKADLQVCAGISLDG